MIQHMRSLAGALILLLGGAGGAALVVVKGAPLGFAVLGVFLSAVGAGWLWIDFIAPERGN
jgi:hypothetical protein